MKKQNNFKTRNSTQKSPTIKRSTRGRNPSASTKTGYTGRPKNNFKHAKKFPENTKEEKVIKRESVSFLKENMTQFSKSQNSSRNQNVKSNGGLSKNSKKPFHTEAVRNTIDSKSINYKEKGRTFDRKKTNLELSEQRERGLPKQDYKASSKVPFKREYKPKDHRSADELNNSRGTNTYDKRNKRLEKSQGTEPKKPSDGSMRLNKYLSNAGIASRRDADTFITAGLVSVNGKIVTELGVRVMPSDDVRYNGSNVKREVLQYFLMNKPKDYICTTDDPFERKTVMELAKKVTKDRIYPVGRLDRNTTGLLLMTNDGELAQKLMHPKTNVKKIYQVELNKNFKKEHFDKLLEGIELEDGFIKPDEVAYDNQAIGKKIVGITMHSGRNRIVRRMFEHFDYEVVKLDRVYYGGLTKKDLPRGHIRPLTQIELSMLKMVSKPK
jgi:23S rRNA pseudouridine2605 synthase